MSRIINRAENWERAYDAFRQINFAAWDYETVKQSLIDYLKLYFPEDFNDFIESSEFIALIELFAYISELSAYRFDLNAHENFITTAERKESVLRLAKLLSYNANRNIPLRGLVKITTISTTERVFDSNGNDLSNVTIRWNDPNNNNWKEQFILVMNRVLDQNFGTVSPRDRTQVQDVIFERYKLLNNPIENNTLPYSITVSNENLDMELVSADLNEFGPLETRPEKDLQLSILYLNDGLGDSSNNTGFFFFTKQGLLQRTEASFDGITPNQTFDVLIENSNETDIFVNQIDEDGTIVKDNENFNAVRRAGEWIQVDNAGGQNVIFNNDKTRNKYEVETLDNDQFRLIFGDGKFASIPSGRFEIWSRISANTDLTIPTTAIQNVGNAFPYQDSENVEQTFNFSVSLLTPIQNGAPSEDIENIRRVAPSVYYTQDRMVNGRDYNEFLLQDNTILKLRAINRTFAGDSKYIPWNDPSESYENVKIFGDDGVVYFETKDGDEELSQTISASVLPSEDSPNHVDLVNALIDNHIEPLLSSTAFFTRFAIGGISPSSIRTEFTNSERTTLGSALIDAIDNPPATKYFDFNGSTWVEVTQADPYWFSIESTNTNDWELSYETYRLVFHSDETKFWNTNQGDKVVNDDTLNTTLDTITVLKANVGTSGVLTQNYNFNVLEQLTITDGSEAGLPSIHDLYILPKDENNDGFPDNPNLAYLIEIVPNDPNHPDNDYVYFNRASINDPWVFQTVNQDVDVVAEYAADADDLWKRESGVEGINFGWFFRTPRYHLVDPAATNIIDMYIITRGYARNLRLWLNGNLPQKPQPPTPFQLRSDYRELLQNKMISDTVVLHPGKIKVIFGPKAEPELRAKIKVIRSGNNNLSNTQIKTAIVNSVRDFFDIRQWEFGETFYFSELSAAIHGSLPIALDSVVLVPTLNTNEFGDLYQVFTREDEIIQADFSVTDIEIVESLDSSTLRQ